MSKIFSRFKKEARILMLGLDGAGKTTTLYKMKLGDVISSIPTVGFNVETIKHKNLSMDVWDVGGQKKLRTLWHHYYHGTHGLIYIVDSSDQERIDEAAEELHAMLESDELRGVSVLVLANKQDLPKALGVRELAKAMRLSELRGHEWYVAPVVATRGDGLEVAFDWLVEAVNKKL